MGKGKQAARERRTSNLQVVPDEGWVYRRPPAAELIIDNDILPDGARSPLRIRARAWMYRRMHVWYTFTLYDLTLHGPGDDTHISRIDCCHSTIHHHQFYRGGGETTTDIAEISNNRRQWATVDSLFLPCHDRMNDGWDKEVEIWRRG